MSLSVVLTSFNYGKFLIASIESILAQTMQPDEFIIIDDASTDGSLDSINAVIREHPAIRLVSHPKNQGILYSLNEGLQLARSDYIVYAAADDVVLPSLFEESMHLLTSHPQAGFCSAQAMLIDEQGQLRDQLPSPKIGEQRYYSPAEAHHLMYQYGYWLVGNTAVFQREFLLEAGGFPPALGPLADSFASQVLANRHGFCFIPKPLAAVRILETSYSSSSMRDYQTYMEFIDQADYLRKTVYQKEFSADLSDELANDIRYTFNVTFRRNIHLCQQKKFIAEYFPPDSTRIFRWMRWMISGYPWLPGLKIHAIAVYYFIRYHRWKTCFRRYVYYKPPAG